MPETLAPIKGPIGIDEAPTGHDTPVIDGEGARRAVIGVSIDMTEGKSAEDRLAARERWFGTLVASSSDFIVVVSAEGVITFANRATADFLGFDPTRCDKMKALAMVHEADLAEALTRFAPLARATGTPEHAILRVKDAHGAWRHVDASWTSCLEDPAINGIVVNARDVTENRRLSRALQALSRVNEIIVHATSERELLEQSCTALVEFGDYLLAWVGRPDHGSEVTIRPFVAAGDRRILDETASWACDTPLGQDVSGAAIRTRCPQIVNTFTGRRSRLWREAMARYGIASECSLPLALDDEIWSLSFSASEENAFDAPTVAVFQQLAGDLVFGIGRLRDADRLAQSEQNLRQAERLAQLGHWVWDLEANRFDFLAAEAFAIHGIAPEEWGHTYEAFLALIHPEDLELVEALFATTREHGSAELRARIVRPNGEIRHVAKRAEAVRGEDGRVSRILGTCMDVTAMVTAEAEREEARQFLAAITDDMAEGLLALDTRGVVTFVNEAGSRLLGWPPNELVGRLGLETFHPTRAGGTPDLGHGCAIAHVLTDKKPVRVERDTFVKRSGTLMPVAYSASPLAASPSGGVVVVFEDITDRVAEQRRVEGALETLAWVGRVRDALDQNRFVLYAQPIVDLHTGDAVAHELLIRMVELDGTVIAPGRFLPAAEKFGLVAEIDRWVVTEAARIARFGISVEFNLSAKSVMDPTMVSFIAAELRASGAAPEHVVCEITETALMVDLVAAERFVRAINDIGCRVALDDFGVGYVGFSALKRLPVATIKIDREFVADVVGEESSRKVVAAVVSLAKAFSAKTVAEGAEDMETVATLKDLGVDYVQGYVFGHPIPVVEAFRQSDLGPISDATDRSLVESGAGAR